MSDELRQTEAPEPSWYRRLLFVLKRGPSLFFLFRAIYRILVLVPEEEIDGYLEDLSRNVEQMRAARTEAEKDAALETASLLLYRLR